MSAAPQRLGAAREECVFNGGRGWTKIYQFHVETHGAVAR